MTSGHRPTHYNNGLASPLPSPCTPKFKDLSPRERSPMQLPPMQDIQYSHSVPFPGRTPVGTPLAGYSQSHHQVRTPPCEPVQRNLDLHEYAHSQTRLSSLQPSLLERLPREVQMMIYSRLPYQSLIYLSTMNRYFHHAIQPTVMAHPDDMFAFVMRAAKDFKQHRPVVEGSTQNPGNFECYVCYTVRGPDSFDGLQPQSVVVDASGRIVRDRDPHQQQWRRPDDGRGNREVMLRRFCIECGVKTGLHAPGDCLKTKAGRELWVCRCQRVWVKPDCLRCPDCLADCPLRPKRDR